MSEREKGSILEALSSLPEKDKQFVLGYAAGRAADVKHDEKEPDEESKVNGREDRNGPDPGGDGKADWPVHRRRAAEISSAARSAGSAGRQNGNQERKEERT